MYICLYVYLYICIYVYICVYVQMYICTYGFWKASQATALSPVQGKNEEICARIPGRSPQFFMGNSWENADEFKGKSLSATPADE